MKWSVYIEVVIYTVLDCMIEKCDEQERDIFLTYSWLISIFDEVDEAWD